MPVDDLKVDELELQATLTQYKDFMDSFVWKDLRAILKDRIQNLQDKMLAADNMDQVNMLKGGIIHLRAFLEYPEVMIEEIERERKASNG